MKSVIGPMALVLVLTCCTEHHHQLEYLQRENDSLKFSVDSMSQILEGLRRVVIVTPTSYRIKLGEEYEAMANLIALQEGYNPSGEFYVPNKGAWDTIGSIPTSDPYSVIFRYTPTDTGHYLFDGHFEQYYLGEKLDLPIQLEFIVE